MRSRMFSTCFKFSMKTTFDVRFHVFFRGRNSIGPSIPYDGIKTKKKPPLCKSTPKLLFPSRYNGDFVVCFSESYPGEFKENSKLGGCFYSMGSILYVFGSAIFPSKTEWSVYRREFFAHLGILSWFHN